MANNPSTHHQFGDSFLDEILDWVGDNIDNPEDVFDIDTLIKWAEDNGFAEIPNAHDHQEREV